MTVNHKIKVLSLLIAGFLSLTAKASYIDALGEFETGAKGNHLQKADFKVGKHKEVSRYQILPRIWKIYAKKYDPKNPEIARTITIRILNERINLFYSKTGRVPQPEEIYALWNAPTNLFKANYNFRLLSKVVKERSLRYKNLYESYYRKI
jgi:hypothetical protein